jgi:hypothetical protein
VGGGIVAICMLLLQTVRIIDKRITDRKPISSPVCRALVAMVKIAVAIGTASFSAVIGTLVMNCVHDQSLAPRHSAYAAAIGFSIFVSLSVIRISYTSVLIILLGLFLDTFF